MRGAELAARIRESVSAEVAELGHVGLATVQVGDDPASRIYLGRKHEAAQAVGIVSTDRQLSVKASPEEVVELVGSLAADDAIDGVLVQLPLPEHLDEALVILAVDPVKDVDGLHPVNAGALYLGRPAHVPATPLGIMALLVEHRIPLDRKRAVVVGRSDIVGKPIAHLLLQANATVTICHSHTDDLARHTLDADVLVVAAGIPRLIDAEMVKQGAAVIDVGVNRTSSGVVGDVDSRVAERAAFLAPVPGGVGPMTIAMLLRNTVRAALYRRGSLAFPGG